MDRLMHTRWLKRVTEGSHWKESKQVPFLMISVLRTACTSTRSCIPGTDKEQSPWEMAHEGKCNILDPLKLNVPWQVTCSHVALRVWEQAMRMKTKWSLVQWVTGPAASVGPRCRAHSESSCCSWLHTTRLSQILSFSRHYADIRISCFHPRPLPSGLISGTISKCIGSIHAWCHPGVPRSMLSWSQSYSLLRLALGFVTRRLF